MTPIRALFFLAAITAACAARIPTQVQETRSLETQIALLASHRLTGNPIENGIDKIKELVQKIQAKIQEAEAKLIQALEKSGSAVAKSINDFILKRTGVDLKLDEKLEALEKKEEVCLSQFEVSVKGVVAEIKEDTETCADKQVNDVKEIVANIQKLVTLLEVIPQSIANIKQCAADPTPAPEPETTTPEAQTDAPTPAPETEAPAPAVALRKPSFWKTIQCVAKELSEVSKELVEVPVLLEKVVEDVKDLSSQENRQTLEACALKAVSGKAPEVQTAAAQLAYCVIAPAQQ